MSQPRTPPISKIDALRERQVEILGRIEAAAVAKERSRNLSRGHVPYYLDQAVRMDRERNNPHEGPYLDHAIQIALAALEEISLREYLADLNDRIQDLEERNAIKIAELAAENGEKQ
jgi:hypothetical protein